MRDYQCLGNEQTNVAEVLKDKTLKESMLYEAEHIAETALAIKDAGKSIFEEKFCKLPFDHVLEAESLGAIPYYDEERVELRISKVPFDSLTEISELPGIDFEDGRINQVLMAAEMLVAQDIPVILNISGPFTILNGLIPSEQIFRGWKKEPEFMDRIFVKLSGEILRYVEEGRRRGIKFFSYADPLGGVNILGPKLMEEMVERHIYPLILKIKEQLNEDAMLILCPKTSLALIDLKKAETKEVSLSHPMSYQEGILEVQGKCKIVGMCCINQFPSKSIRGSMEEIILI